MDAMLDFHRVGAGAGAGVGDGEKGQQIERGNDDEEEQVVGRELVVDFGCNL